MNDKFFAFLASVWEYIDRGAFFREPFKWLYVTISLLNLLFPPYVIYSVIDSGVFRFMSGGEVIACILVFLLFIFLGIMSFSLWMDRQKKVKYTFDDNNDFVAIPVVSHFIQTLGEWIGFYIGVGGCVASLLFVVFGLGDTFEQLLGNGMLPMGTGLLMVVVYPVLGYLIVVSGRLMAELYRALASIANNTKSMRTLKSDFNSTEKISSEETDTEKEV